MEEEHVMGRFHFLPTAALIVALAAPAAAQTTMESHWLASAFAGTNFGEQLDEPSADFGGSIGYLWRGVVGGEFQANLTPEFDVNDSTGAALFESEPWINSYMANAIGAVPLGAGGDWRPYFSGGLGILTLRSDALADGEDVDDARMGGNVGVGVLGLIRAVGIRWDVRYFNGFGKSDVEANDTPGQVVGKEILAGLGFWRTDVGVAFRF
jgi:hypothetical protein